MDDDPPSTSNGSRKLLDRATCPHCWHRFPPEDSLWIASHVDLRGDPRLGESPRRFLPSRFTPDGYALDAKGMVCRKLACPRCHLEILWDSLEVEPLFLPIVGDRASGKSFYLTASIQQLRPVLFHDFHVQLADADPSSNRPLTGYIESLFGRENDEVPVPLSELITKTQTTGELYVPVNFGSVTICYPQPFMFSLQPAAGHPTAVAAERLSRILCLYDCAGEQFHPGTNLVTNSWAAHLALSRAILFLFDPTQDRRFRDHCLGESQAKAGEIVPSQQITILDEVARRVREHQGLTPSQQYYGTLVVVLTKFDVWSHLLDDEAKPANPWIRLPQQGTCILDTALILSRSRALRELLMRYSPASVAAAEGFARDVIYVAVSALADRSDPSRLIADTHSKLVCIRPRDVRPFWTEVPILYALSRSLPGLIPHTRDRLPAGGNTTGDGTARGQTEVSR